MKKILILSAGPVYLLLLAGFTCTHQTLDTKTAIASFWKRTNDTTAHYLYIDNVEKGVLPFISDSLSTAVNNIAQEQGLTIHLKSGSYDIMAKDKRGSILCTGTLFMKNTEGSTEIKSSWENSRCSAVVVYDK